MPLPPTDSPRPTLYALPGNHDWYDGLTSFMRRFAKGRQRPHRRLASAAQARSYFALRLPQGLVAARDRHAVRCLHRRSAADLFPRGRVAHPGRRQGDPLLADAELGRGVDDPGSYDTIDYFVRTVINPTGAEVKVMLSGDLHHYARYEGPTATGSSSTVEAVARTSIRRTGCPSRSRCRRRHPVPQALRAHPEHMTSSRRSRRRSSPGRTRPGSSSGCPDPQRRLHRAARRPAHRVHVRAARPLRTAESTRHIGWIALP